MLLAGGSRVCKSCGSTDKVSALSLPGTGFCFVHWWTRRDPNYLMVLNSAIKLILAERDWRIKERSKWPQELLRAGNHWALHLGPSGGWLSWDCPARWEIREPCWCEPTSWLMVWVCQAVGGFLLVNDTGCHYRTTVGINWDRCKWPMWSFSVLSDHTLFLSLENETHIQFLQWLFWVITHMAKRWGFKREYEMSKGEHFRTKWQQVCKKPVVRVSSSHLSSLSRPSPLACASLLTGSEQKSRTLTIHSIVSLLTKGEW